MEQQRVDVAEQRKEWQQLQSVIDELKPTSRLKAAGSWGVG